MKILKMIAGGGMNDARELAEMVRRMGRGNDTILAHITPEEADLLRRNGGSGETNPMTGLPEFQQDYEYEAYYGDSAPSYDQSMGTGSVADIRSYEPPGYYGTSAAGYNRALEKEFGNQPMTERELYDARNRGLDASPEYSGTRQDVFNYNFPFTRAGIDATDIGFGPGVYTPPVSRAELAGATQAQLEASYPEVFKEPGVLDTIEEYGRRAEQFAKERPTTTRLLMGGGSILGQALVGARARRQAQAQADELRRQAAPFRAAEQEALARARGTGLTAQQQREMDIAQARARQGLSERNMGTGSAAAGMLAAQRQRAQSTAREQSFNEALRLAGIADKYTQDALRAEIDADSQLAQLLGSVIGREAEKAGQTENVGKNQQQQQQQQRRS